jgi:hypothetical protein
MSFEIALVAGILAIVFVFAFLSFKLGDNHQAIKFFFMLLSFLFVAVGLAILKGIAEVNYSTSITNIVNITYIAYLFIFSFLVLYFGIVFILNVVSMFMEKKQRRADEIL